MLENVKKCLILKSILLCFTASSSAQIWKDWEIKGGLVYNNPNVLIDNHRLETNTFAGYNLSISKLFPIVNDWLHWELGLNHSHFNWNQQNKRHPHRFIELNADYTYLNTGFILERKISNFRPFVGSTFRIGRLIKHDFDKDILYLRPKTTDYGIDYKIGIGYEKWKVKPFLELSYYYGLGYVIRNRYRSYNEDFTKFEDFESYKQNRVVGISTGIRF